MHDPVADVLNERLALDRSPAGGFALSFALHALLAAGAVYAALNHRPPKPASVIDIRFAQLPRQQAAAPARPRPAAPPRLQEPRPVVEQAKAAPKPEEKTIPFSPFGRSTKKGSDAPPPAPAAPPAATATGIGVDVPIGGAGVTGLEGGDFPYTLYIERMKTLIGSRWLRPQVTPGTTATIYFVIDRDGTIRDVRPEMPSGHGGFDRAAVRAVLESSPLPPLPFGYNGTYLGVHLTFK